MDTTPNAPKFAPAPSDAAAEKAWDQIMGIAQAYCLVIEAYCGVATLAIPSEQRSHGVREKVLRAHMRSETAERAT